jgi:hypothetical protein
MARLIRNSDRIDRARALIKKVQDLPTPTDTGMSSFSYVAEAKDLLRQARDLVKFIPQSPSANPEVKQEAQDILTEIEQAQKDVIRFL